MMKEVPIIRTIDEFRKLLENATAEELVTGFRIARMADTVAVPYWRKAFPDYLITTRRSKWVYDVWVEWTGKRDSE